ncbi:MAG: hypothetical protein QF412_02320 [Planctomycetota bacterium]|jgi:hypothetical protein|nr:hypothetical protein [Planctomycetota bacterium]
MTPETSLFLPAILGGVAVFFMSFLLRMVASYHWKDFSRLPDEESVMDALRSQNAGGGQFSFPHCANFAQMKDAAWQEHYAKGPKGILFTLPSGPVPMGKALLQSFLFNLVISLLAAWAVTQFMAPDAAAFQVWCFVAILGFLAFGGASVWGPIWRGTGWRICLFELMDGALYGAAMGLPFYLLV